MTSDPEKIRAEVMRVLSGVPEPDEPGADIEAIAVNLEEAHELLVAALEAVERAPAGGSATEG